jgi:two-component system, chemotaxis family, CheB/CheR fusion protein
MMRRKMNGKGGGKTDPPQRASGAPSAHRSATPRAPLLSVAKAADLAVPLVVGLGASAGGLEAFTTFLTNMPPRSGMAFVLVQHLDPVHKSLLVELLSKHTAMPVMQAEDGTAVAADHVFIIPPNATLTIAGGTLRVATPAPPREHRKPIDAFFSSLAKDQEENAVCIILAGTGSDGSLGLQTIKAHGGLTLAQAGFDETALLGMPSSAAATGLVDEVLPVERMPARLLAHVKHLYDMNDRKAPDGTRLDAAEHLAKICMLLRARLGHDFSEYKEKTLVRRIQRRMQVLQIDKFPAYIERLRKEPEQLDLLFRDLLIGVTQFFRDPEAFAALASEVMPKLTAHKKSGDEIRIWVPGCATGEEAYSIAILLKEAMIKAEVTPRVQIFATDLDEHAVAVARRGRYRKPLAGVSPDRLARWFVNDGDDYCVLKDIREMCVFSAHNLARDPPFAKLDLLSCRNLMIYLDAPLQRRLMRTFHYALRADGYLFLGASEGVSRHGGLFTVVDKKHRLFRRGDVAASLPSAAVGAAPAQRHPAAAQQPIRPSGDDVDMRARHAVEKYSPAYLVINRQHEVLRFSGRTGHYVEHSSGAASLGLFTILRKELLPAVRTAVQKAFATRQPVVHDDMVVAVDGHRKLVTLIVEPISEEPDAELYVVAFQDRGIVGAEGAAAETAVSADDRVRAFEKELRATRQQLHSMIEDAETINEELKSSNEEYQSVNEEFQSANEELESAKEELQSMNEELHTINGELNSKNEALADSNSDLKNLLDSTQIATLFLDKDLHIKNFTPAFAEIFHVRATDRGRPITEIVTRLSYAELKRDVKKVLRSLSMVEHEVVAAAGGATFVMRIRPYRTVADVIAGVVITFVDISDRKRHEEERARLAAIITFSKDAIIGHSLEGTITSWNSGAEHIFGYTAKEAVGKPLAILLPQSQVDEAPQILERLARGEQVENFDAGRVIKTGERIDVAMTISPVLDERGAMIGASTIAHDVSERKRSDELRVLMVNELNHRVKNTLATVQSIAAQSLKGAADSKSREAFDSRLVALSRRHDVLANGRWERASLRDLVLQELGPYQSKKGTRAAVEGPDTGLTPKAALALGMAFHELATNAAKYGAFSKPRGRVRVAWEVQGSSRPMLRLTWTESGGPKVTKTGHKGFGSTLIERGLSLELNASVRLDLDPGGLICTIEIPLPDGGGGPANV